MRQKKFSWKRGHTIFAYQIPLLLGLPFYFIYAQTPSLGLILSSLLLYSTSMLAITAGFHRLYSHRAYRVNKVVEFFMLFFGSLASQKSVLRWAYEHRVHHAFVDSDRDPYSIKKGFWYAHVLWLFDDPEPIDPKIVADLMKNSMVMFQHKHEDMCLYVSNFIPTVLIGWLLHDFVGAIVISLWLRIFFVHHCTYFINSLAHTFGSKPFSKELSAVNNFLISIPTFGEGFHNFHHAFPNDYRNGVRWFDFDPTKWLIWVLCKLGLATDLKQVEKLHIREMIVTAQYEDILEALKNSYSEQKELIENKVNQMKQDLALNIKMMSQLIKNKANHLEIRSIRKQLKQDLHRWKRLWKAVMKNRFPQIPA